MNAQVISLVPGLFWLGHGLLALVFALAGITKLRALHRASEGLMGFGVPDRWAQPTSIALALTELGIAALLAYPPTQPMGAMAGMVLLLAFTLALAWQLLHGHRPSCACFGALTQSAISWKSVGRNLALMALAGGLVFTPKISVGPMVLAEPQWPALIGLAWAALSTLWLWQLTRQNGRLLLRIEQLEQPNTAQRESVERKPLIVGASVPPLGLLDAHNRAFNLQTLRGRPVLFLFLDAHCNHCRPLLARLRDYSTANANAANVRSAVVVISEYASLWQELPPEMVMLVDPGWTTQTVFGVRATPAAVLVDTDGALAQTAVHGTTAVRAALDKVMTQEVGYELAPV